MRITTKLVCAAAISSAAMALAAAPAQAASSCESLTGLKLPHVTITAASEVAKAPLSANGGPTVPSYCKVLATAKPTADSDIRFEVAIPLGEAWKGRYLQLGNGGFAGTIPERQMGPGLAAGFAVAGTDNGHQSTVGTDAKWALGHPEKVIDFGYRSLKETTDASKAIIRAYAGRAPRFSYFAGCSDGGREALMEAQRYPDDFDGIVAGDPANHWTHLLAGGAWDAKALSAPGSALSTAKLATLEAAALKACGDQDGVVENPPACRFDPGVIACKGADSDKCLTDAQVAAVRKIYAGPRNPRTGEVIMSGYEPGAEAEPGGWANWISGPAQGENERAAQFQFARNFFAYVMFADPNYDIRKLDFDRDIAATDAKYARIFNAYDPDLGAFRRHGGKLIQYHGWADPAIPAKDSIAYYQSVQAKMGDTGGFYRLFLAPGMLHCGGGRGFSQVNMPALMAVVDWREGGPAPDRLIVAKTQNNNPAQPVERTRPLCAYPLVALWDAQGDRNRNSSYLCVWAK